MATTTVLLTGFEPFGGEPVNPSALAVRAVAEREIAGCRIVADVLPVTFGDASATLVRRIDELAPALVICVGQAGGTAKLAVERIAINIEDAPIPDNAGAQPIDRAVDAEGPAAYWSTLPIKAIVAALVEDGVPAAVSASAGTFVCNHVFYALMRALARRPGTRGGFVHVPFLPEQAARAGASTPSMTLAQIVRGLELVITTTLATEADRRIAGGATH